MTTFPRFTALALPLLLAVTACGEAADPGPGEIYFFGETGATTAEKLKVDEVRVYFLPEETPEKAERWENAEPDASTVAIVPSGNGWIRVEGWKDEALVYAGYTDLLNTSALAGSVVPAFIVPVGKTATDPGQWQYDHGSEPPATLIYDRTLLIAGSVVEGERVTGEYFNLSWWYYPAQPAKFGCDGLSSCEFHSLFTVAGSHVVAVGADWARWFDYGAGTLWDDISEPDGLDSFTTVSGAFPAAGADGNQWLAAATLPKGEASDAVLRFHVERDATTDASGNAYDKLEVTFHKLGTARRGAATAWMPGFGLAVVGGSAEAAGVELLGAADTSFEDLPFAPDSTTGAVAVPMQADHLLRLGGVDAEGKAAKALVLDLGCKADCVGEELDLELPLSRLRVFPTEAGAYIIGDDSDQITHLFTWTEETRTLTEVALEAKREGAGAALLPFERLAIIGGAGTSDPFEVYQPKF